MDVEAQFTVTPKVLEWFKNNYTTLKWDDYPIIYGGFPHQIKAQLIGVMNRDEVFTKEHLSTLAEMKYDKHHHEETFYTILNNLVDEDRRRGVLHPKLDELEVLFFRLVYDRRRRQDGSIWYRSWEESTCLSDSFTDIKTINYRSQQLQDSPANLKAEFPIGSTVVCLDGFPGKIGKIVNIDEAKLELKVKLSHYHGASVRKLDIQKIIKGEGEDNFFTLESVPIILLLTHGSRSRPN
jgi:hypothetical protein